MFIEDLIEHLLNQNLSLNQQKVPEAYIRKFYTLCNRENFDEIDKLRDKVKELFEGESVDIKEIIAKLHSMGVQTFISIEMRHYSQTRYFVRISRPGLDKIVGRIFEALSSKNETLVEKTFQTIVETMNQFTGPGHEDENKIFASDVSDVNNELNQIVNLSPKQSTQFNITSLIKLNRTGFNWSSLVERIIGKRNLRNLDDVKIIYDAEYIGKLVQIMNKKSNEKNIINYLKYLFIIQFGLFAGSKIREIILDQKYSFNIKKSVRVKLNCLELMKSQNPILGRIYINKYNVSEEKKQINKIFNQMKKLFESKIVKNDWMNDATKSRALIKLTKMTCQIGYPEWIVNDTLFEEKYNYMSMDKLMSQSLLEMAMTIREENVIDSFKMRGKGNSEWPISLIQSNVTDDYFQNKITIAVPMIRGIFFSKNYPSYVNYAQLGFIISHELSHAFDSKGIKIDKNGNQNNWLDEKSARKFKKRSENLIEQYSKATYDLKLPDGKSVKRSVNGSLTLDENIVDNEGIRLAFKAWKNQFDQENKKQIINETLDHLECFTSEQLFFISYANNWCNEISHSKLNKILVHDSHAPNELRTNFPLSNFDEFSKAFHCRVNSMMKSYYIKFIYW